MQYFLNYFDDALQDVKEAKTWYKKQLINLLFIFET